MKSLKGIFIHKSAIFQIALLLFLILTGIVFASTIQILLQYIFFGNSDFQLIDHLTFTRGIQFISSLCIFLLPSLLTAWLCSNNISDYLEIKHLPDMKTIGGTFLSIFFLYPAITLTAIINRQMVLPECMRAIEQWIEAKENAANTITTALLQSDSILILFINLIVIAVMAGIGEEFLFRGSLQRIINKQIKNKHIVIWLVAILFSAIHLQFYGFIPRMLLGAYFGYLLIWSKNLWVPVVGHFANNGFAVILLSNPHLKNNEYVTGDIPASNLDGLIGITVFFLIIFFFILHTLKKHWIVKN